MIKAYAIPYLSKPTQQLKSLAFFVIYMVLFSLVDNLNLPYSQMQQQYGVGLVVANILLNIVMAALSTLLMILSSIMIMEKGVEAKGNSFSFVSILFGLLTYGCTPCVIALIANFGITFSVIALPFAGFPYKIVSLILIGIGLFLSQRDLKQKGCRVRKDVRGIS